MSGALKSIGSVFKGVGNFLGIGKSPKRPSPVEAPTLKDYSPVSGASKTAAQQKLAATKANLKAIQGARPPVGGRERANSIVEWNKKVESAQYAVNIAQSNLNALTGRESAQPLARNPNILGAPGAEAKLAQWDSLMAQYKTLTAKGAPQWEKGQSDTRRTEYYKTKRSLENRIVSLESDIIGNIWRAPAQVPTSTTLIASPTTNPSTPTTTVRAPASAPTQPVERTVGTQDTLNEGGSRAGSRRRRGRVNTLLTGLGDTQETLGG